jgi:hypothetical protein
MKKLMLGCFLACAFSVISKDLAITLYNQDRALVKDVRQITMQKGISTISITDVAGEIDPTSVHFKSLNAPDKVQILEQNYEYDLVGGAKILAKYVDQDIRLVTEKGELFEGILLSAASDIVIQDPSGAIKIIKPDQCQYFDLPKLPDGLITRPTLRWQVQNSGPESQDAEISYLTSGMNWHAEYVAVVNEDDSRLELGGWVSIDNQSGSSYENARLKLVAGDVNLIQEAYRMRKGGREQMDYMLAEAAPQFEEKSFFEYHLYTLQRRTTLKDSETKQISLFPAADTKTEKLFIYEGGLYDDKIRVFLEIWNKKADGLGLPLPAGKVRVYKKDTDSALEFIGEDRIDHTPSDERIRLLLGNAFDLTAERNLMDDHSVSPRASEQTVEIVFKNHKKEEVTILAVERFGGNWKIIKSTLEYRKKDAYRAEFDIPIPPGGGEVKLGYTVLITR